MRKTSNNNQRTSFDKRIVRYERVHSIKRSDFDALCSLVEPTHGSKILDLGAGYGACTREIVRFYPSTEFRFTLADNSAVQLERSRSEIPETIKKYQSPANVEYFLDDIVETKFEDSSFDVIVAKMVLHEIKKPLQLTALKNIRRLLKPKGKLIIWDLYLNNGTRSFFQSIIREKDRLCEYDSLISNRYFLTGKEHFQLLNEAGFTRISKEREILSPVISKNRLKDEFGNRRSLLEQWHRFIRNKARNVDGFTLFDLSFRDFGDYLSIVPPKALILAQK